MEVGGSSGRRKGKKEGSPPDLFDHCIFCVRKVDPCPVYRATVTRSGMEEELISVVPRAKTSSQLLPTLNLVWPCMRSKNGREMGSGGEIGDIPLEEIMTSTESCGEIKDASPSMLLPPLCQFCAGEVLQLDQLMTAVRSKVTLLRTRIRDSKHGGLHSWRMANFEKNLKMAGLDEEEITKTVGYWDDLGDTLEQEEVVYIDLLPRKKPRCCDTVGETQFEQEAVGTEGSPSGIDRDNGNDTEGLEVAHVEFTMEEVLDVGAGTLDLVMDGPQPDDENTESVDCRGRQVNPLPIGQNNAGHEGSIKAPLNNVTSPDPDLESGRGPSSPPEIVTPPVLAPLGDQFPSPRVSGPLPDSKRTLRTSYQYCEICGIRVKHRDIWTHARAHVGDFALRCPNAPQCPYVFCHSGRIPPHLRNICKFNGTTGDPDGVPSGGKLKPEYRYTCETCEFTSSARILFRRHLDWNHEQSSHKNYTCPVPGCDASFTVRQSVDMHLGVHKFRDVTFQNCDLCGAEMPVGEMKDHLSGVHASPEILSCPRCPFTFPGRASFVEHLYLHRHLGLTCDICDSGFKFSRHCDLRFHVATVHQVEFPPIACGTCGEVFASKTALQGHTKVAHPGRKTAAKVKRPEGRQDSAPRPVETAGKKEKPKNPLPPTPPPKEGYIFGCPDCGKAFKWRRLLKQHHDFVHLGLRSFVCESCGEGFGSPGTLTRHKRIHTEERPFKCEFCGQGFRHREVMRQHSRAHAEKGDRFKPNGAMKTNRKRTALK